MHYEQGGLCIYCQQKLPPKAKKESSAHIRSHLEHIHPRSSYPFLIFDYCNLSVSCEGFDCKIEITNQLPKKEFCEHRKANEYDEKYFLNPVEVKDIENYFVYDVLTLEILPKHKEGSDDFKKAEYMRKILDLNNKELIRMRKKLVNHIEKNGPYEKHEKVLPPFYSMLDQLKLL